MSMVRAQLPTGLVFCVKWLASVSAVAVMALVARSLASLPGSQTGLGWPGNEATHSWLAPSESVLVCVKRVMSHGSPLPQLISCVFPATLTEGAAKVLGQLVKAAQQAKEAKEKLEKLEASPESEEPEQQVPGTPELKSEATPTATPTKESGRAPRRSNSGRLHRQERSVREGQWTLLVRLLLNENCMLRSWVVIATLPSSPSQMVTRTPVSPPCPVSRVSAPAAPPSQNWRMMFLHWSPRISSQPTSDQTLARHCCQPTLMLTQQSPW